MTVEAALGERPAGDKLARAVVRERVASQLFAKSAAVKLGRYSLIEQVGAGGMGVVWGAWDPELDRRVAIKLVREERAKTRDRILIEGQALAKLSHPNVVPVYDVGVVDGQIYIVMEWVRGKNLRAWAAEPHTKREIVAVYRQAAQGLAAAHGAGLIHRDFKPENAIRGDDGRVRVLDFGLARDAREAEAVPGVGTPQYMAPEQAAGGPLTAAVDQYAFCVSLREALGSEIPRWLAEICTRGTQVSPADRFGSMDELLAALARDPAIVWRRRLLVSVGIAAAAGAFAIGSARSGDAVEHCVGGSDEIAKIWNPIARGKLLGHLAALGPYAKDEMGRIERDLAHYAGAWAKSRDSACRTNNRGELTPAIYERGLGCLARAQVALDTTVELMSSVDDERFPNAVVAARSLPDPDRCAREATASKVAPPARAIASTAGELANQIERARVLAVAVDPRAVDAAAATVVAADRLGYPQLVARANLVHGLALTRMRRPSASPLDRAVKAALDADDDDLFVEAYAREIYAIAIAEKSILDPAVIHAIDLLPYAVRIATRTGVAGALGRARLYNDVAVTRIAIDDRKGARLWFDKALAEAKDAPGNVELAGISGNLALVLDDPAARDRAFADEIVAYTRALGENHPLTLEATLSAAMFTGDRNAAATSLRDTSARMQRLHPHLRETVDDYVYELGWLAEERGDTDEARRAFAAVRQASNARVAAGYLALLDGKHDEAFRTMHALGRELEASPDYWVRVAASDAYTVAATSAAKLGRDADAIESQTRALALLEKIDDMPAYRRRLARCRATLAHLLATREPQRARELADLAATWYRSAGSYDSELAALDAIVRPRLQAAAVTSSRFATR